MWILLAVVLKASSPGSNVPILDKPLVYNTLEICEASMKDLYDEYKKLQANYPVEVMYKENDNKQKYMMYSYKPDYTKPKITTYYYCLKVYNK